MRKEDIKNGLGILAIAGMFGLTFLCINALPEAKYSRENAEQATLYSKIYKEPVSAYIEPLETEKSLMSYEETAQETETEEEMKDLEELKKNVVQCFTINGTNCISLEEYELMCRIVMNEAGGENYRCEVAVAETIINRVNRHDYPNTITGVVNQKYQYSHHENGEITDSCREACLQALEMRIFNENMVYFRDDYYHGFPEAEDYIEINNMYFSLKVRR